MTHAYSELYLSDAQIFLAKGFDYALGDCGLEADWFGTVFARVPLSEVLSMYRLYHEMDLTNFVEDLDGKYAAVTPETKLKKVRESRGLSQSGLASLSGVTKRSIQLYEQRVNDIDKAQAQTLYKLSRVLGCQIEDLLENPESR